MPPTKCPICGRFLKNEFLQGLDEGGSPCPRCGTVLTAEMFGLEPAVATTTGPTSVRPPDLAPVERDVLDGWDRPADVIDLSERRDAMRAAAAADSLVTIAMVVGGGLAGGMIGGLVLRRRRRTVGTVLGTVTGATAALVAARLREQGRETEDALGVA